MSSASNLTLTIPAARGQTSGLCASLNLDQPRPTSEIPFNLQEPDIRFTVRIAKTIACPMIQVLSMHTRGQATRVGCPGWPFSAGIALSRMENTADAQSRHQGARGAHWTVIREFMRQMTRTRGDAGPFWQGAAF